MLWQLAFVQLCSPKTASRPRGSVGKSVLMADNQPTFPTRQEHVSSTLLLGLGLAVRNSTANSGHQACDAACDYL